MDSNISSSHHVTGVSLMIKLGNLKKVKGEESLDNNVNKGKCQTFFSYDRSRDTYMLLPPYNRLYLSIPAE